MYNILRIQCLSMITVFCYLLIFANITKICMQWNVNGNILFILHRFCIAHHWISCYYKFVLLQIATCLFHFVDDLIISVHVDHVFPWTEQIDRVSSVCWHWTILLISPSAVSFILRVRWSSWFCLWNHMILAARDICVCVFELDL